jgi:dTDP-4-amino-4,6-dideoxygalactose transaminase
MFRIGREEADAASRVIMSGSLFRITGKYEETLNFEREFKDKMGAGHCLCLSSGTGALSAALAALGVGPGDEVIVPAYTFIATAVAVLAVGAIPVLADIDETLTIDPADVGKKITKRTKAIVPVHIWGLPCDMDALMALARQHGIFVVEDACQAIGGEYHGKKLGTFGDCGAFSFNFYKIISAGEGGALVTDDQALYERAIIYHDCGSRFWPYGKPIEEPFFTGVNMRVNEITGAVLREQLKRLDGILADLRRVKGTIADAVCSLPGIRLNPCNDPEGDCGLLLPFTFGDTETAMRFEELTGGVRPINTEKHVYSAWEPILSKRGAHSEGLNPYRNPLNQGLNMDFHKDSCPRTLDILSRSVYHSVHCDWDGDKIRETVLKLSEAAETVTR